VDSDLLQLLRAAFDEFDVEIEALDLEEVMAEALALALPLYPRAEGVDLGEAVYTEPGKRPMSDEEAKPLAGLAELLKKQKKD